MYLEHMATFNFQFDLRFSILPPAMNEVLTWHRRAEVVNVWGGFSQYYHLNCLLHAKVQSGSSIISSGG